MREAASPPAQYSGKGHKVLNSLLSHDRASLHTGWPTPYGAWPPAGRSWREADRTRLIGRRDGFISNDVDGLVCVCVCVCVERGGESAFVLLMGNVFVKLVGRTSPMMAALCEVDTVVAVAYNTATQPAGPPQLGSNTNIQHNGRIQ